MQGIISMLTILKVRQRSNLSKIISGCNQTVLNGTIQLVFVCLETFQN